MLKNLTIKGRQDRVKQFRDGGSELSRSVFETLRVTTLLWNKVDQAIKHAAWKKSSQ